MKPPDKDGSEDREGPRGTLLLLHGGLNDPDAEPTAHEPTATQDPPLPSSNALGPNSNLHLGWYLPADNPSQPAPETTEAASSAQPPAEADAATPADERADLRGAAPVTAATESALIPQHRGQPRPSWARSVPGDRPAAASAPVPFPGLAARALSTLTGRVTIGRLLGGIGVLAAAAAAIVLMPVSGIRPTSHKRPVRDAGSVFLVPPILTARTTTQAHAAAHHTRHVGHSNPRERRASKVSEPRRTIVAANAASNFSAERSAPSRATTPSSQSAATTNPTPAAPTQTSPTPAATSTAGSSAANQSSTSNARPAFGYNGTLGPGHSPDS
jgi:hypothetical protein